MALPRQKINKLVHVFRSKMSYSSLSQFIQPCGPLFLCLMVTTATAQE